jgi:replicative DNA helicase
MAQKLSAISSESIVIGGLINHLDYILELTNLKTEYFTVDVNKVLYHTLKKLYKNGSTSCDILDIYAIIEQNQGALSKLEEYGGEDYIQTLAELADNKSLDDIVSHSKIIIDCAYKNELSDTLTALENYVARCKDEPKEKVARLVEGELLELKSKYGSKNGLKVIGDDVDKIVDKLNREGQKDFSGFPTFSPMLNKFMSYERGELVVYSGKLKTGKSQMVVNEVYRLCIMGGVPTAVLDTELSTRFFVTRLISRITGYNMKYIKSGKYKENPVAVKKFNQAVEMIRKAPLVHKFVFDMSQDEIANELKKLKVQINLQIVFFDYIKSNVTSADDMQERLQMAHMTNFLKNKIAGDLDVAVVALAQTTPSKDSELRIFGSSQVAMYASTIVYLVRKTKEQYERDMNELGGNYYLFIKENRNGQQFDDEDFGININFNTGNCTIGESQFQHDIIIDMITEQEIDYKEIDLE